MERGIKMKRKILNTILVFVMMISTICILTGCGKKTENIIVYVNDGLNDSKITAIEKKLKGFENVNSIQYTSKENAYEEAKAKIGQEALEMAGYTKSIHPFPSYFTIEVKKEKDYDALIKELESIDGVKTVKVEANSRDVINAEMNYIKNQK